MLHTAIFHGKRNICEKFYMKLIYVCMLFVFSPYNIRLRGGLNFKLKKFQKFIKAKAECTPCFC